MLEHLQDHHRPAQCTRCWELLNDRVALESHMDKLEPRCIDQSSSIHLREGIDENSWELVARALRTPKPKRDHKTDKEKWLEMWAILFPAKLYPLLPVPKHPFYIDPETNLPTSSYETERRLMLVEAILDERAKISNLCKSQDEYHSIWEEISQAIRRADAILINSSKQGPHVMPSQLPYDQYSDYAATASATAPELGGNQGPPSPMPGTRPIGYAPIQPLNSNIQEHSPLIDGTLAQNSPGESASMQHFPYGHNRHSATTTATAPTTTAGNGVVPEGHSYTDEEIAAILRTQFWVPGNDA